MDHLHTFVTICEYGNFSEAARVLFVPQPTISNRIRFMETVLDRELFIRGKNGVKLTPEGALFLPYAKQILDTYSTALSRLNPLRDKEEVVIGSTLPFTFPFILEKIQDLYFIKPTANLSLLVIDNQDIISSLLDRKIDIAFSLEPLDQKDLEVRQIGAEQLIMMMAADHPLLSQLPAPSLSSLEDHFIVYYQPYYDMFRSHPLMNLKHRRKFVTNHSGLIKQLILRMNAVSFLPFSVFPADIQNHDIVHVPLHNDLFSLSVPYYLIFRRNERYYEEILLKEHNGGTFSGADFSRHK